ncbi:hypothetical protein [Oricola thermophila]|uniref:Uncharacterized protein n=1 Tax=Oricola thermophila TaxID=2742145 RepID=A0A6N1VIC8_9HYPH|nr:hypothetical protein [Oricola thermophila]QKV18737.1 hypothetical protein HTY61_09890 [Oricola thermophila]
MTARSRIVIVTDDAERVRREVFGGTVPAFARIVSSATDFDSIGPRDEAFGIFHAPRGRECAVAVAWRDFWTRHHPRFGLSPERLSGFARWRAERGLPPHPAVADISAFGADRLPSGAKAVSASAQAQPSEVSR